MRTTIVLAAVLATGGAAAATQATPGRADGASRDGGSEGPPAAVAEAVRKAVPGYRSMRPEGRPATIGAASIRMLRGLDAQGRVVEVGVVSDGSGHRCTVATAIPLDEVPGRFLAAARRAATEDGREITEARRVVADGKSGVTYEFIGPGEGGRPTVLLSAAEGPTSR